MASTINVHLVYTVSSYHTTNTKRLWANSSWKRITL